MTTNPIVDFENSDHELIKWGEKTLGRNPETGEQIEEFFVELAELVKNDKLDESPTLYEKYPLVRIGVRRALFAIQKRGMIPRDFTWGGNEAK